MAIDPRDKELSRQLQKDAMAEALQADEFRSIEDWRKHYLPNGIPEQPEIPQLNASSGQAMCQVSAGDSRRIVTRAQYEELRRREAAMLTDAQIDAIAKKEIPAWAEWTNSTRAFARAIERAAREEAIRECAKACQSIANNMDWIDRFRDGAAECADVLRALREGK
jgi:hypothetical protein